MIQSMNPEFMSMRSGVTSYTEFYNMSFASFDAQLEERRLQELWANYPVVVRENVQVHMSTVAITVYNLVKPFLSRQMQSVVRFTNSIDGIYEGMYVCYQLPSVADYIVCVIS